MNKFCELFCGAFPFLNESKNRLLKISYRFVMLLAHICLLSLLLFLAGLGLVMMFTVKHDVFQKLLGWIKPHVLEINQLSAIILVFCAFLCGLSAYNWREKAPSGYGFIEALVGAEAIAIAFIIFSMADDGKADSAGVALMFSLIGGVYIIVRGLDNMMKARKQKLLADQKKTDQSSLLFLAQLEYSADLAAIAAFNSAKAAKAFAEAARLGIMAR